MSRYLNLTSIHVYKQLLHGIRYISKLVAGFSVFTTLQFVNVCNSILIAVYKAHLAKTDHLLDFIK